MALLDKSHLYDKLKEPFVGHAIVDLLIKRGRKYEFVGSFSIESQEEYESSKFIDNTVPEEDSDIDPWTGESGNMRSYADIKDELPSWEEVLAEHQDNLREYAEYAGKRARVYPDWRDQLDMLYKDIDSGKLGAEAKTSQFYSTIKQIKDSNQ